MHEPTSAHRPGASDPGERPAGAHPVPRVTLGLMAFFLIGGSLGLLLDWPDGPANADWGVWVMVYGGYLYVIAAAFFYAKTGK